MKISSASKRSSGKSALDESDREKSKGRHGKKESSDDGSVSNSAEHYEDDIGKQDKADAKHKHLSGPGSEKQEKNETKHKKKGESNSDLLNEDYTLLAKRKGAEQEEAKKSKKSDKPSDKDHEDSEEVDDADAKGVKSGKKENREVNKLLKKAVSELTSDIEALDKGEPENEKHHDHAKQEADLLQSDLQSLAERKHKGKRKGKGKGRDTAPGQIKKQDNILGQPSMQRDAAAHSTASVTVASGGTSTQRAATSTVSQPATPTMNSWVRIPYPLSSFYPPATQGPSAPDSSDTKGADKKDDDSGDEKKTNANPYCYGMGMSQLRESTVELVNEAADAIWKHTKRAPGTRSDTDDL